MKNLKVFLTVFLGVCLVFNLVGCTNSENKENEVDNSSLMESEVQRINKENLGVSLDLSGEFADCSVVDLSEEASKNEIEHSIGGFEIYKTINEDEVLLSRILVVRNEGLQDPIVRSVFPFTFQGNDYSVVVSLPLSDTASDNYTTVQNLQSDLLSNQLMTLFLDESVLPTLTENEVGNEIEDNLESVNDIEESLNDVEESLNNNEDINEQDDVSGLE